MLLHFPQGFLTINLMCLEKQIVTNNQIANV
jgi:hypothetical protein